MATVTTLRGAEPEGLSLAAIVQVLVDVDGGPGQLMAKLVPYLQKQLHSMLDTAHCVSAVGIKSAAAELLSTGERVRTAIVLLEGVLQEAFHSNMAGLKQTTRSLLVLALRAAELPLAIWKNTVAPLAQLLLANSFVSDVAAYLWTLVSPSLMDSSRAPLPPGQLLIVGILASELQRNFGRSLASGAPSVEHRTLKGHMDCLVFAANSHLRSGGPPVAGTAAIEPGSDSEQSEDVASASEGEEMISDGDNFSDLDDFVDRDPSLNVFGFLTKTDIDPAVAGHCGRPGSIREFFATTRTIPNWRHRVEQLLHVESAEFLKRPAAEPVHNIVPAAKRRCTTANALK